MLTVKNQHQGLCFVVKQSANFCLQPDAVGSSLAERICANGTKRKRSLTRRSLVQIQLPQPKETAVRLFLFWLFSKHLNINLIKHKKEGDSVRIFISPSFYNFKLFVYRVSNDYSSFSSSTAVSVSAASVSSSFAESATLTSFAPSRSFMTLTP